MTQIENTRVTLYLEDEIINTCFDKDLSKMDLVQQKLLLLSTTFTITYKALNAEIVKLEKRLLG